MIKATHISKTYHKNSRKAQTVLEDASIVLPDKGLVAVIGPSGSGKSTILNAIGGLISYDGTILYDGNEVEIEKYRRENIGYIFQDFLIFENLSIRDNIRIGLNLAGVYSEKEISRRVDILLKAVGLKINASRSAGALSSGQKQRVAIARALANNPRILLADEPTGNLDSENSIRIMKILKRLSSDRLVVLVTHNENLVHLFGDEAFCIKAKKFEPVNPLDCRLDETYQSYEDGLKEEQKIQSVPSVLKKEEYSLSSLHVTLYSSSDQHREITLIEKDGKVYVQGKNIELIEEKDVPALICEEKKSQVSETSDKEKGEKEELSDVSLDFPRIREKRPVQENPFLLSLQGRNPINSTTYKGKRSFHWMEVLLSLLTFILLNIGILSVHEMTSAVRTVPAEDHMVMLHLTDEKRKQMEERGEYRLALSTADLIEDIKNEDSALIGGRSSVYQLMRDDYSNPMFTAFSSQDGHHIVSLPEMTFTSNLGQVSTCDLKSSCTGGFLPFEVYSSIFTELQNYQLKDQEVIVDAAVFNRFYPKIQTYEDMIGGKIRINVKSYTPYVDYKTYIVKGVVNTGIPAVYALENETLPYILDGFSTHKAVNSLAQYDLEWNFVMSTSNQLRPTDCYFPSLEGYEFVRYEDLSSDKYTVTGTIDSPLDATKLRFYSNEYNGTMAAVLSDSAAEDWDWIQKFKFDSYSLDDYGCFLIESGTSVTSVSNPDQKVMVFYPAKTADSAKTAVHEIDSYSEFFRQLVIEKIQHHLEIDSDNEEGENDTSITLHLPDSLVNAFSGVSFTPSSADDYSPSYSYNENVFKRVRIGDAYNGSIDDPIRISYHSYLNLLGALYNDTNEVVMEISGTARETIRHNYESGTCFLLSKDPQKTIEYYKNKGEGYEAYTISEAKSLVTASILFEVGLPYAILVVSLFLVFLLFTVLDGIGRINSLRYNIGVLRSLGASKGNVLEEEIGYVSADYLIFMLIPNVLLYLLLLLTGLDAIGAYVLMYLVFYYLVVLLSSLVPLLILLGKKPADILRSLS